MVFSSFPTKLPETFQNFDVRIHLRMKVSMCKAYISLPNNIGYNFYPYMHTDLEAEYTSSVMCFIC